LTFFTLPIDYTKTLHEEIFSLVFHGNGGFTHSDVYNMPVRLRRFYLKILIDIKKKEADEYKKAESKVRKR